MRTQKQLPEFLKPYFWSYNFDLLDTSKNKRTIVKNILYYGDQTATSWLFSTYPKAAIRDIFAQTYQGEYDSKSLRLWETVFGVTLKTRAEIIANNR